MEYTLIRSKRKTLALQITREAQIVVRAPARLPKPEIERFLNSRRGWIEENLSRQQHRQETYPEPTEAERAELIARARLDLPERVERWSAVMGLVPAGIKVTSARSRFGSCSGKDSLCFAWRLMQYPEAAIDYVVVHELAHIRHKNHGPDFYALIESVLPDWKERRALLLR